MAAKKIIKITCKGQKYLPPEDLEDFQGNLKRLSAKDKEKLRGSLEKYGFSFPVFIWQNKILDGHQRLKVLQEMLNSGWVLEGGKVPVVEIDARDEKEAGEKLLILNSRYAKFTQEGLWEFITEKDIDWSEMAVTLDLPDFSVGKFEAKFFDVKGDEDNVPEVPEQTFTEPGDLWVLGAHRLYCGDAFSEVSYLTLFQEGGEKADIMITDPPYGVSYTDKNEFFNKIDKSMRNTRPIKGDKEGQEVKDYKEFFKSWLFIAKKFLKKPNTFYIFINGKHFCSLVKAIEETGGYKSTELVWVKNHHVLGRQDYMGRHELIIYGWYGKHKFYGPARTTVLENISELDKMSEAEMRSLLRTIFEEMSTIIHADKPHRSPLHPTMKPVYLAEKFLRDGSGKGAIVLDSFGGSGFTLIAAEKVHRQARIIEIDPHYCDIMVKRWLDFTGASLDEILLIRGGREVKGWQEGWLKWEEKQYGEK